LQAKITSQNKNVTGAYLIIFVYRHLLTLMHAYMEKQLCYHKLQSKKIICSSVLSCYFEAEDTKKQKQTHCKEAKANTSACHASHPACLLVS